MDLWSFMVFHPSWPRCFVSSSCQVPSRSSQQVISYLSWWGSMESGNSQQATERNTGHADKMVSKNAVKIIYMNLLDRKPLQSKWYSERIYGLLPPNCWLPLWSHVIPLGFNFSAHDKGSCLCLFRVPPSAHSPTTLTEHWHGGPRQKTSQFNP